MRKPKVKLEKKPEPEAALGPAKEDRECSTTIIWSGGADSTLALCRSAQAANQGTYVYALSLDVANLPKHQIVTQRKARERFLKWAKKQGWRIQAAEISVSILSGKADVQSQMQMWLSHLSPYFWKKQRIVFSYIKHDEFWHFRKPFEAAFDGMNILAEGEWTLEFPYEWATKRDIVDGLKAFGVPDNCWWTCEFPKRPGVPCGECSKCKQLAAAADEKSGYRLD